MTVTRTGAFGGSQDYPRIGGLNLVKPEYMNQLFAAFGDQGWSEIQFFKAMGAVKYASPEKVGWFEDKPMINHMHMYGVGTPSSGYISGSATQMVIRLDPQDFEGGVDTASTTAPKCYPQLKMNVRFDNGAVGRITAIGTAGTPAYTTFTITNIQNTGGTAFPYADYATGAKTVIQCMGYSRGEGGQGVYPHTGDVTEYENFFQTFPESCNVTDYAKVAELYTQLYNIKGSNTPLNGIYTKEMIAMDYRLMLAQVNAMLFGVKQMGTTPAIVDATGRYGKSYDLNYMEGILTSIGSRGITHEYTPGAFGIKTDFDAIVREQKAQMVSADFQLFLPGIKLAQDVNDAAVLLSKNATDFNRVMAGVFAGAQDYAMNLNWQTIGTSNKIFIMKELGLLSNPNSVGVYNDPAYDDPSMDGYIIPVMKMPNVKAKGFDGMVDSINVFYRKGNGTSLEYNYIERGNLSNGNKDGYADMLVEVDSTMTVLLPCANQCVKVTPEA